MAAFRGSGGSLPPASNGGGPEVDPALYRNLVEMIPLMESFMDQQGARTSMFGHHASMIYTPAPLRESMYKNYESPLKAKKTLTPLKRTPGREEVKEESLWEESENILRRIEGDSAHEDSTGCHSFCKDTCHLQLEIEELKQKLWEKDCLLQTMGQPSHQAPEVHTSPQVVEEKPWEKDSVHQRNGNWHYTSSHQMNLERNDSQYDALENGSPAGMKNVSKDLKVEDMMLLQSQVEKLRQELCEKDRYIQSAQLELHEQQQGLGEMRLLLEQAELSMAKTNHKAASMEAELNSLRCQVLTLRYQLDAVDATDLTADVSQPQQEDADREGPPYRVDMVSTISEQEVHQKTTFLVCVSGPNDEEQVNTVSEECKEEREKLEFVRRKYLASVIAAREKPVGESLLMVAECRRQLNNYLTDIPFMAFFGSEHH